MAIVLGVCGGSGSGKTTFAQRLIEIVGVDISVLIQQDNYYKDFSKHGHNLHIHVNFDHPESLDFALLKSHVRSLLAGEPFEQPVYDFQTHSRLDIVHRVEPRPVVVLDGILILTEPELREMMSLKIFVDAPDDIRFIRRLQRDRVERGRSVESVIDQYLKNVRPMHQQLVEPCRDLADIVVPNGTDNLRAVENAADSVAGWILQQLHS